ncbi:MAG: acyl-ACP--UDP-N-acetylglucosamine O-acyltransferase [Bacteroidia bacterium]|nr:acyl-ACP--UDP-N-acetylglucosamine O-acyltransferase [Bacteroidia bacterium]
MIQPLAYVHPQAKIDDSVVIDPFVTIHRDVEIGAGTHIMSGAVVFPGSRIGKNCKVFPGASIGAIPQDLKYNGEETLAIIGDNTIIRENVTINKGTVALGRTEVGSNCLLMAYSHVAHDCIVGNNCILANTVQLAGHVVIADFVIVGGMSAVYQFVHIGQHVMIAGGCMVRKDVPPYTKAGRQPISYEGVNSVGLRRRGFSAEKINEIQDIYRTLYLRGNNTQKALAIIENEKPASPERDEILQFIRESEGGIMRGYSSKRL